MQTSDLLLLIKSLSKAERKNFRILATAKQDGGGHAYIALYEELEKISDDWEPGNGKAAPADSVLEKKLKQKEVEGSVSAMRNYLSKAILKSLRQLYEKNSKRSEIEIDLKDALILENRGLLGLAAGKLHDALDMALQYEYHALAFDILQHLIRIESQADFETYAESFRERLEKIKEITRFLDAEACQFTAYYRAFLQFRLGMARENTPADVPVCPEENGEFIPTFLAKMYHYQLLSLEALLLGNAREAMTRGDELLSLWKTKPEIKKERLGQYIRHFSNYLNFCIAERSFERFEHHLNELKAMHGKGSSTLEMEAELEQNILLAEQLLYLNTDRLEEARTVFPKVEEALKKYGPKINKARETTLRYNHIVVLFALSEYITARDGCTNLINDRQYAHRPDLQLLGKIWLRIIYYELRDHDKLGSLVSTLGRTLKHSKESRDFERIILQYLLKLVEKRAENWPEKIEKEKTLVIFKQFQQELIQYKSIAPAKLQIGLEEILIWIQSKVEDKPFREILKQHWNKK